MDAVCALAAVLFDLTRTTLHASVAPLRLIDITAGVVIVVGDGVVVVMINAGGYF